MGKEWGSCVLNYCTYCVIYRRFHYLMSGNCSGVQLSSSGNWIHTIYKQHKIH